VAVLRRVAPALVLAAPTVVAFFSGGFMNIDLTTSPRAASWYAGLLAGVVACVLVAVAPRPLLPRSRGGRAAVAGLAGLAAWVGLSLLWAPLSTPATQDLQRLLLYVAAFVAAAAWLRGREHWVQPALAGGILVVVGYALSARYLPGIVHQDPGQLAPDRLNQPLTYYNALGCLAAIGFVLCARMRGGAVAACVPLGLATYLTVSRGALAALLGGVIALTFLAPTWGQLRATVIGLAGAGIAVLAAGRMDAFQSLGGGSANAQGAAMLAITLVLMAVAFWLDRGPRNPRPLPLPTRAPLIGFGAIVAVAALLFAAAYKDRKQVTRTPAAGTAPARLTSIESNRYAYWEVAIREFGRHPLKGVGTAGFRVAWLRERKIDEAAQDAHSLYIETLCELGVVGFGLLALFYGGVIDRARRLYAVDPAFAAGPAAALTVFALHAGVDWDWEMPAVTLVALVLAATVLGASETRAPGSGLQLRDGSG
jgi:hypothetical protein